MSREVIVEVNHMKKCFGPTIALNDVNITIRRGEILGLIGENGSGKSTVTSIVSGMQKANEGEMFYEGRKWEPHSMIEALEEGIGMIVQESGTVPGITVAENIFLGETDQFKTFGKNKKWGAVKRKEMIKEAQKALDEIGASHIRADIPTAMLDMQERKLVEIAKVMIKNPQVLIVDGVPILLLLIIRWKVSNFTQSFFTNQRCLAARRNLIKRILKSFMKSAANSVCPANIRLISA